MKSKFKEIWKLAVPYLKKGKRKDSVVHTKGVIKAMEILLKQEKGDPDILIPAAILHDIGWSKVSVKLQMSNNKDEKIESLKLHIKHAPLLIKEILTKIGYNDSQIKKVISIVVSHKFQDPKNLDKRLLIDADTLSDAFKEQFWSDVKSYNNTPKGLYEFRKKNKFYTKIAKEIFNRELKERKREFIRL